MNRRTKTVIIGLMSVMAIHAQRVTWVSSTESAPWQTANKARLEEASANQHFNILISDKTAQDIEGFGACFSELAWDALMELPEKERNAVIHQLFSPQEANFTYNRIPMGASDFALNFYSFNDVAEDFGMVNFSIDRDRHILLRFIKAAQEENPDMKFFASPWAPPAWMKTNNHYASTANEQFNGMSPNQNNTEYATAFKMQDGYLKAYALYFSKFIKAYGEEGVPVSVIYVQNEPFSNQIYASCKWRPEDIAYFIGRYLGPQFEQDGIGTAIYFGTANTKVADFIRTPLNDELAARYIRGVGFQWDGKHALPVIRKEYPQLRYMQTESECGNGDNSWDQAEYTWNLINHYLTNGVNSYAYWNIGLDQTASSPWGWHQNSLITVDRTTRTVRYNPEYYIMKHVSRYVVPGAHLLETNGGTDHLAFRNPDGSTVLVVVNTADTPKDICIGWKDKALNLHLEANSFNTLVF